MKTTEGDRDRRSVGLGPCASGPALWPCVLLLPTKFWTLLKLHLPGLPLNGPGCHGHRRARAEPLPAGGGLLWWSLLNNGSLIPHSLRRLDPECVDSSPPANALTRTGSSQGDTHADILCSSPRPPQDRAETCALPGGQSHRVHLAQPRPVSLAVSGGTWSGRTRWRSHIHARPGVLRAAPAPCPALWSRGLLLGWSPGALLRGAFSDLLRAPQGQTHFCNRGQLDS